MAIWTLATKDVRLLLRDRRVFVLLLAMPVIFILVLGMSLGEGFFSKPDDRLRVSVLDLDQGAASDPVLDSRGVAIAAAEDPGEHLAALVLVLDRAGDRGQIRLDAAFEMEREFRMGS